MSKLEYVLLFGITAVVSACGGGGGDAGTTGGGNQSSLQSIVYTATDLTTNLVDLMLVNEDGSAPLVLIDDVDNITYRSTTSDSRIIFSKIEPGTFEQNLYAINADGNNEVQLTSFSVSVFYRHKTDDDRIIFEVDENGQKDIYTVNADGSQLIPLTDTPLYDESFEAVAADGSLIFKRIDTQTNNADIYRIDLDGTNELPLAVSSSFEDFLGVTSDNRVVYRRDKTPGDEDIYSVSTQGTDLIALTDSTDRETFSHITRDGNVLFTRGFHLFSVSSHGGVETRLDAFVSNRLADFRYELESGQIVFTRRPSASSDRDLYIVDPDGNNEITLANVADDVEQFVGVSSNGRIIFSYMDAVSLETDLYAINPDGTGLVNLTNTPGVSEMFSLSGPDGQIIFHRTIGGQNDLIAVDDEGLTETVLANTVLDENFRALTNNGRVIMHVNNGDIKSVMLDGSDIRDLAVTSDFESFRGIF